MRFLALILLASPVAAWEASRDGAVCRLSHVEGDAEIEVRHDPRNTLPYAIELTLPTPWTAGDVFAIRFDGLGRRTISTDRHVQTDEGRSLTVSDTGFGNVLDGIALNEVATAMTGETALIFSLSGAAPEVEKFRACILPVGV